jgi:antitoxin (DNA-binding transcriptional repressor) of toxin-antitoxin stability system
LKKICISITETARDRVQNITFVVLKNGSPVARLVPDQEDKVCAGGHLAEALAEVELPASEAKAWRRDLLSARKSLKSPVNN